MIKCVCRIRVKGELEVMNEKLLNVKWTKKHKPTCHMRESTNGHKPVLVLDKIFTRCY